MNFDEINGVPPRPLNSRDSSTLTPENEQMILSYSPAGVEGSHDAVVQQGGFTPGDLRVPWGWRDLVHLVAVYIGTMALSILGLVILGSSRNWSGADKSFFLILNQLVVSLVILAYMAAQLRVRFNLSFWRTLGWHSLNIHKAPPAIVYLGLVVGGFLLSIAVQLGSVAVGTKTKLPMEAFFQDRRTALLLMLMSVLLAPLFEETLFRGYIYPVVARTFGVTTGVIATGTLFGLLHAPQLWGGWGQIGLLVLVGIIFTWLRATTKTVLAGYLVHLSYNSFLFFAFVFASHGLRSLPSGT